MNIEKKYGVMIATPCYGGQLTEAYLHGILSTTVKAQQKGIQVHLNTMGNESLITRARNTLVTQFLDADEKQPDRFTHLLFIDSDIGFSAENVIRLVESDYDVSAGIYPRKSIDWKSIPKFVKETGEKDLEAKALGYNLNFAEPGNIKVRNGFTEVLDAATGFMCIKKEVFYKMKEAYSNLKYTSDQIVNGKSYSSDNCYDLFCAGIYETNGTKRYLSEDYYFSRLWQECGGDIWADIAMPLTHFGNRAFKGHVGSLFKKK